MKVIIIEDEKLSADHLQLLLKKIVPDLEVITVIDSVRQSVILLKNGLKADLIFLDIHLADDISFTIFNEVEIDMPIIFTTAYNEYALKAFEVNSIDYLLKPIALTELERALAKFSKLNYNVKNDAIQQLESSYRNLQTQYKTRFLVKSGSNIESIKTDAIHHFTTIDGISFLVNHQGKKYPVDFTLDHLEGILPPNDFFRINRKTIIHINAIQKLNTFYNSRLVVTGDYLSAEGGIVSRDRVPDFKAWLDK